MLVNSPLLGLFDRWLRNGRAFLSRFGRRELSLIDDEDFVRLLDEIGRRDDLRNGRLECFSCGKVLSQETLSGFFVTNDEYHFLCESTSCFAASRPNA